MLSLQDLSIRARPPERAELLICEGKKGKKRRLKVPTKGKHKVAAQLPPPTEEEQVGLESLQRARCLSILPAFALPSAIRLASLPGIACRHSCTAPHVTQLACPAGLLPLEVVASELRAA